jgi:hypothetical protein
MANVGQGYWPALLRHHFERLQDPHCTSDTHFDQYSERAQRIKRDGGIRLYWQGAVNRDFVLRRSNSRAVFCRIRSAVAAASMIAPLVKP